MAIGCDEPKSERAILEEEMRDYLMQMHLLVKPLPGRGDKFKERIIWIDQATAVIQCMSEQVHEYHKRVQCVDGNHADLDTVYMELKNKLDSHEEQLKREKVTSDKLSLEKNNFYERFHTVRSRTLTKPRETDCMESVYRDYGEFQKNWREVIDLIKILKGEFFYREQKHFMSVHFSTTIADVERELIKMAKEYLGKRLETETTCVTSITNELCRKGESLYLHTTTATGPRNLKMCWERILLHGKYKENLKKHQELLEEVSLFVKEKLSKPVSEAVPRLVEYIKQEQSRMTQCLEKSNTQRGILEQELRKVAASEIPQAQNVSVDEIRKMLVEIQVSYKTTCHCLSEISRTTDNHCLTIFARTADEFTEKLQLMEARYIRTCEESACNDQLELISKWRSDLNDLKSLKKSEVKRRVLDLDESLQKGTLTEKPENIELRYFSSRCELDQKTESVQRSLDFLIQKRTDSNRLYPVLETTLATPEARSKLHHLVDFVSTSIVDQQQTLDDIESLCKTVKLLDDEQFIVKWCCPGSYDNPLFLANLCEPNISTWGHNAIQQLADRRRSTVTVINIINRRADFTLTSEETPNGEDLTIAHDGMYSYVLQKVQQNVDMPEIKPLLPVTLRESPAPFVCQNSVARQMLLPRTLVVAFVNTRFRKSLKAPKPAIRQNVLESLKKELNERPETLFLFYQDLRHDEMMRILATLGQSVECSVKEMIVYVGTHGKKGTICDITGDGTEISGLQKALRESIKAEKYCIALEACRVHSVRCGEQEDCTNVPVLYMCDEGGKCHLTCDKLFRFPLKLYDLRNNIAKDGMICVVEAAAAEVLKENRHLQQCDRL